MTRIVLDGGRHVDIDLPAHTVIAMRIEQARIGHTHLAIEGQLIPLDEIAEVVPAFRLCEEAPE